MFGGVTTKSTAAQTNKRHGQHNVPQFDIRTAQAGTKVSASAHSDSLIRSAAPLLAEAEKP